MNILFIAPVPPPLTGQSLAVKTLYNSLIKNNQIVLINLNKDSFKSGLSSLGRICQILKILKNVLTKQKDKDIIYFTISESFAGNLKDLLIYSICYKNRRKIFIHMLGGAGMKKIIENGGMQYRFNKFFISKLGGVIVEGQQQATVFSKIIAEKKIHVVPNFAEDFLFADENEIKNKFSNIDPLRILFLSNLLYGKGYIELVNSFLGLSNELKKRIRIIFVGGFESDRKKTEFLRMIRGNEELIYHGTYVGGNEKKTLYMQSHIFCLPTYYPFEGQPISILEAYATGCVVITTYHSGIPDIFCDGLNGFRVETKSSESIKSVIEQILEKPEPLHTMAVSNRKIAYEKYRTSIYNSSLIKIIENTGLHI